MQRGVRSWARVEVGWWRGMDDGMLMTELTLLGVRNLTVLRSAAIIELSRR